MKDNMEDKKMTFYYGKPASYWLSEEGHNDRNYYRVVNDIKKSFGEGKKRVWEDKDNYSYDDEILHMKIRISRVEKKVFDL